MKDILRHAWWITSKDLRIEARTGEVILLTGLFAVLVAIVASLSFYVSRRTALLVAPGVLWVATAFAGVLAMGRAWQRERELDVIRTLLLAPIPRASIYLGKALGTLVFLLVVETVLLMLTAVLFHIDLWPILGPLIQLLVLGSVGFIAAGNLFAAMSVRTRARDLVLSVVVFPLISPALLAGVVATRDLLSGAPWHEIVPWYYVLAAFDIAFISAGLALFDSLISE